MFMLYTKYVHVWDLFSTGPCEECLYLILTVLELRNLGRSGAASQEHTGQTQSSASILPRLSYAAYQCRVVGSTRTAAPHRLSKLKQPPFPKTLANLVPTAYLKLLVVGKNCHLSESTFIPNRGSPGILSSTRFISAQNSPSCDPALPTALSTWPTLCVYFPLPDL